jgi:hypothetical protein
MTSPFLSRPHPSRTGSTLESTWGEPDGTGRLEVTPGEPLQERFGLGGRATLGRRLATLVHLTDAHILDASSPARVPFLDRLGRPFHSTFRPQEALTAQVLAGALAAVRAVGPDALIQGGDLIDNAQHNELALALAILRGGEIQPPPYHGVQRAANPDPAYYRPDLDEPRHPALLDQAAQPLESPGVSCPVLPVLGDHDVLVAGELLPNELLNGFAVGEQAMWTPPSDFAVPPDLDLTALSGDGPPFAGLVSEFLIRALQSPLVTVPADPGRRLLAAAETVAALGDAVPGVAPPERLDYVYDLGERLRVVVLDLASRVGGSSGQVLDDQVDLLDRALSEAGERWVVFVSHQTLRQSAGGERLQELLDASRRVILLLNGHTHHNRIRLRETSLGGHWEVETASLIDWPQQARALQIHETIEGGVAIRTWMLDHVSPGRLGRVARELSYLDEEGGAKGNFRGSPQDRNAVLYLPAPR